MAESKVCYEMFFVAFQWDIYIAGFIDSYNAGGNEMPQYQNNRPAISYQENIARRQFLGSAIVGAIAATGVLTDIGMARPADRPSKSFYKETIETPIVARYN
jgi:hypothetical protein